jgi:hypothetical protein
VAVDRRKGGRIVPGACDDGLFIVHGRSPATPLIESIDSTMIARSVRERSLMAKCYAGAQRPFRP